MKRSLVRLAAGAVAVLALPVAPAAAVPVTVRIVGTSVHKTVRVNTTTAPVPGNGCAGTSAAGALERATGGRWDRQVFFKTLLGETHDYSANDYWSFWVDGSYSQTGICDYTVRAGDELLFFVQRDGPGYQGTVFPLYFASPPQTVRPGRPFTVTVTEHRSDGSTTAPVPAAGATVSAGAGRSAVTGPDGRATLTAPGHGAITLRATLAGMVATPATRVAVGAPRAPAVTIASPRHGHRFAPGHGPRTLRGSARADGSLRRVELRLRRRAGQRCSALDGRRHRLVPRGCRSAAPWVSAGRAARWSYRLARRLPAGLYHLQARAVDATGATSPTRGAWFRVR